ncbi:uncharacterized protein Dsimw501_GD14604, isoform C [Drosophila simulans]|uniref:Uncharacterized protein, isoform C n=2 Tax=Drosophila simulans TaxID=7240 RepID=A0A0J9RWC1_DROSI|nr:uncharacterized protein LOC6738257 [Drosophila simulans]KMY99966.1 uncharacterized protein Dsimw501_GD14604, isoform C [Drosophila simulans]
MSKWLLVKFWLTLPMICFCHVTFTNLNCSSYNLDFMSFPTCRIKAVNRTHKYISIYAKINQLPIVDARVTVQFRRFDSGYKPFLFDLSYDGCQFMKNQKNMFVKTFYKTFQRNTNMNHTCPYDHDIIVDKLFTGNLEEEFGRYIVIPNGDYAIYTDWATNKVARASVKIYLRILNK